MLKSWALAAVIAALMGTPAWAQPAPCGAVPAAPALPSAAAISAMPAADALTAKHQAFADITQWQKGALKDYRDCLDADEAAAVRKRRDAMHAASPDQGVVAALQAEIDADEKASAASLTPEEQVVTDFHAVSSAYCARADVDRTSCPKT